MQYKINKNSETKDLQQVSDTCEDIQINDSLSLLSLQGIEKGQKINNISVQNCINLIIQNELTTLKESLTTLKIKQCTFAELNCTGLTKLVELDASENRIREVKLNGCTAIERLNISRNLLSQLDLSSQQNLQKLIAHNNAIMEVVSNSRQLKYVNLFQNNLNSADFSKCDQLDEIYLGGNKLMCIPQLPNNVQCISLRNNLIDDTAMLTELFNYALLKFLFLNNNPVVQKEEFRTKLASVLSTNIEFVSYTEEIVNNLPSIQKRMNDLEVAQTIIPLLLTSEQQNLMKQQQIVDAQNCYFYKKIYLRHINASINPNQQATNGATEQSSMQNKKQKERIEELENMILLKQSETESLQKQNQSHIDKMKSNEDKLQEIVQKQAENDAVIFQKDNEIEIQKKQISQMEGSQKHLEEQLMNVQKYYENSQEELQKKDLIIKELEMQIEQIKRGGVEEVIANQIRQEKMMRVMLEKMK